MNLRSLLLYGVVAFSGCAQGAPVLDPGRVPTSEVGRTQFHVSGIPFVDYLEAMDSELKLRDGVEVWIGPLRAEILNVDEGGMVVHLSEGLPPGSYDLRVLAAADHFGAGALEVVVMGSPDGGTDGGPADTDVSIDAASDAPDAAPSDASADSADTPDASLCPAACELDNASSVCRGGVCEVEACIAGFDDCDAQPMNGCEISTATSTAHCGACGNVCGAGEACFLGECGDVPGTLATGREHSCVVRAGEVYCWGSNIKGELGSAAPSRSTVAIPVAGLTDAVSVAAGNEFSCALHVSGAVSCWGSNTEGALGDDGADGPEPRVVAGIVNARAISAGRRFVCALIQGGEVRCWGRNDEGQLGAESPDRSATPLRVPLISTAVDVDCGDRHACAVLASDEVRCWGEGNSGALGNGDDDDSDEPVRVVGLTDATSVSAGLRFACATQASGGGVCWGEGSQGQLGDGFSNDRHTPARVNTLFDPIHFSAGDDFTCYLLPSGSVHCWGRNTDGQLGTGVRLDLSSPPPLPVVSDAVTVAAGESHACALRADGAVFCWGRNTQGQLGDGTTEQALTPVRVLGL